MNQESPTVMANWISELGIKTEAAAWSVGFTLSTVPIDYWFYKRNALKPEDIQLSLIVPSYGLWRAELSRHDGLFVAQWRPNGDFRVDSQQMKYRQLVKWPVLDSLFDFPLLVERIEKALSIQFIRHVNLGTNGYVDLDAWALESGPKIQHWLSPCADTMGTYLNAPETDDGSSLGHAMGSTP